MGDGASMGGDAPVSSVRGRYLLAKEVPRYCYYFQAYDDGREIILFLRTGLGNRTRRQ